MKPAWDQLAGEYDGHATVFIGDVDCTVNTHHTQPRWFPISAACPPSFSVSVSTLRARLSLIFVTHSR